jgi:hypothetical protein
LLNWSYRSFKGKLHLPIAVANDSDPVLVTETLLNSAYMEPRVLHNPSPKVIFKGFADTSMEFELWAWVAQMDEGIEVVSSLNFIIEYNLRQMGLEAPLTDEVTDKSVGQTPSIRDALRQLLHLSDCSDLELRKVIEIGYRKILAKADVLFNEGTMDSDFYLILSGSIETTVNQLNQTIKVYHAGEMLVLVPYHSSKASMEDSL